MRQRVRAIACSAFASAFLVLSGCTLLPSAPGGDGGVDDPGITAKPKKTLGLFPQQMTDARGAYWKLLERNDLEAGRKLENVDKIGLSIAKSDALCNEYFSDVSAAERTYLTGLDILDTLFNFAGLIADGAGAKSLWVAYDTAAGGVAADVKTGALQNNEATILMSAMRKRRKALRTELLGRLTVGGDLAGLDFALLIPEIENYHSTCTIAGAIAEIQASVQTTPVAEPGAPVRGQGQVEVVR